MNPIVNVPRSRIGTQASSKDVKVSDDLQLILSKHSNMPFSDVSISRLTIYFTAKKVVGAQAFYELINQKKKHDKKRKISDKITFEFEGQRCKGSKHFGVNSETIEFGRGETIASLVGVSSDQIDSLQITTSTNRTFRYPLSNSNLKDPKKEKEKSSKKAASAPKLPFALQPPPNHEIFAFNFGISRYLNSIDVFFKQVTPPAASTNPSVFALRKNNTLDFSIKQSSVMMSQSPQFVHQSSMPPPIQHNQPSSLQYSQQNIPMKSSVPFQNSNYNVQQQQQQQQPQLRSQQTMPSQMQGKQPQQQISYYQLPQQQQHSAQSPQLNPQQSMFGTQQQQQQQQPPFPHQQNPSTFPQLQNQQMNPAQQPQQQQLIMPNTSQQKYPVLINSSPFGQAQPNQSSSVNQNNNFQSNFQPQQQQQQSYQQPQSQFPQSQQPHPSSFNNNNNQKEKTFNSLFGGGAAVAMASSMGSNGNRGFEQSIMPMPPVPPPPACEDNNMNNNAADLNRRNPQQQLDSTDFASSRYYQQYCQIKDTFSQQIINRKPHSVQIVNHSLVSGDSFLSSVQSGHVMYVIEITDANTTSTKTIHRRYKEFALLRETLVTIYPYLVIPNVPEKSLIKNKDDAFIEDRRVHLQTFLQEVMRILVLSSCKATQYFMDSSVQLKTLFTHLEKLKETYSKPEAVLQEALRVFPMIQNIRQLDAKIIEEIEMFCSNISKKADTVIALQTKAQIMKEKMKNYFGLMNKFKKSFIGDYESSILSGFKASSDEEKSQLTIMSDAEVAIQSTPISSERFEVQERLLSHEVNVLNELKRIYAIIGESRAARKRLNAKLQKVKLVVEEQETKREIEVMIALEDLITKMLYFLVVPNLRREQVDRYKSAVQAASAVEKDNMKIMREYWMFVLFRQNIQGNLSNKNLNQQPIMQSAAVGLNKKNQQEERRDNFINSPAIIPAAAEQNQIDNQAFVPMSYKEPVKMSVVPQQLPIEQSNMLIKQQTTEKMSVPVAVNASMRGNEVLQQDEGEIPQLYSNFKLYPFDQVEQNGGKYFESNFVQKEQWRSNIESKLNYDQKQISTSAMNDFVIVKGRFGEKSNSRNAVNAKQREDLVPFSQIDLQLKPIHSEHISFSVFGDTPTSFRQ